MGTKLIELAKKLKALADRGVDGEKENATEMLERFMQKHKLTLADIEGEKRKWRRFKMLAAQEKLFYQICANVLGRGYYGRIKETGQAIYRSVEVSDAEYIELSAKYDFFWSHYIKEQEIFYKAFIQKNHLYKKETDEEREKRHAEENQTPLTPEEKAQLYKMEMMMGGMEVGKFHKQIGTPDDSDD